MLALALAGCAHPRAESNANAASSSPRPALTRRDAEVARTLEAQLRSLDSSVNGQEAWRLAECAVGSARELAFEYGAVQPALFHNVLVNAGWKRRGLCHHWADDLYDRLRALDLRTLELCLGIAGPGTWREHNAVVVKATGQPFERGIVLDAWRRSGRLYFCEVRIDRHPWQVVMPRNDGHKTEKPVQGTESSGITSPVSSGLLPESASRP